MIRVVFDTNVIIPGRLWSGVPRQVLTLADEGRVQAFISETMLDELRDVINRPKFAGRLQLLGQTAEEVVLHHLQSTMIIDAPPIDPVIETDPDDDTVLACALAAHASFIVTGDPHLLVLSSFTKMPIVTPADFLTHLAGEI